MADLGQSGATDLARAQEVGYYAHDRDEEYVCWDCATPEERADPVVPEWDVADCSCCRCGVWWEQGDA